MEDRWIEYYKKPENIEKRVICNTENPKTCAYKSTKIDWVSEHNEKQNESQKIYTSMAWISSNLESPRRYIVDILQMTSWVLGSAATCHMAPEISAFVPGSLVEMDEYIEVADENVFT